MAQVDVRGIAVLDPYLSTSIDSLDLAYSFAIVDGTHRPCRRWVAATNASINRQTRFKTGPTMHTIDGLDKFIDHSTILGPAKMSDDPLIPPLLTSRSVSADPPIVMFA